MEWEITYYVGDIEEEIFALPDKLLARYLKLTELMEKYGADLGMPHTEALGKGLFELRVKGKEGIARVFYCTMVGKKFICYIALLKRLRKSQKENWI